MPTSKEAEQRAKSTFFLSDDMTKEQLLKALKGAARCVPDTITGMRLDECTCSMGMPIGPGNGRPHRVTTTTQMCRRHARY